MWAKNRETLAGALDKLIEDCAPCTWGILEEAGNQVSNRLGLKTKCTQGIIKAHIKYRQIKDPNYLGTRYITNFGIGSRFKQRCRYDGNEFSRWDSITNKSKKDSDYLKSVLESFLKIDRRNWDDVCDYCLLDIIEQDKEWEDDKKLDELSDDGNDQWTGLDLCDFRGG